MSTFNCSNKSRSILALCCTTALTTFVASGFASKAAAQVVTDGSLGPTVNLDGNDIQIDANLGTQSGSNLFHSFDRFDVQTNGRVTFNGSAGIANVISRVTGGQISSIDGTIASTLPAADIWLMNPAGILFGENARLDVPKSFHASTGDFMLLGDGGGFLASLAEVSQLSVAEPVAFGFLGSDHGDITVQGSELRTGDGASLSFSAANITIDGGLIAGNATSLFAAAAAGPGFFDLIDGTLFTSERGRFVVQNGGSFGDELTFLNAITAGEVLIDGSRVFAGNTQFLDLIGGLSIDGETIDFVNGSAIGVGNFGTIKGGGLSLTADRVLASDGSQIINSSFGEGQSGDVIIQARSLELQGGLIQNVAAESSTGGSGALTLNAQELILNQEAQFGSVTLGPGDAGSVTIDADQISIGPASLITSGTVSSGNGSLVVVNAGDITIDRGNVESDNSAIVTNAAEGSTGNAGSLLITTDTLTLKNGAELSSSTRGSGNAGLIIMDAGEISIENGGLIASITTQDGQSAGVFINVGKLRVDAGGGTTISGISTQSATDATQDAGGLFLEADTIELLNGGSIDSSSFGQGNAGFVSVEAREISLKDGFIASITTGPGDAGVVSVVTETLTIERVDPSQRSRVTTQAAPGSSGRGGTVIVDAKDISIKGLEAAIESASFSDLPAGNVAINAETIALSDGGTIVSNGFTTGPAGSIALSTQSLTVENGAIGTAGNAAEGGQIRIMAIDQVYLEDSLITSSGIVPADNASLIGIEAPLIVMNNSAVVSLTGDTIAPSLESGATFGEAQLLGDLTIISTDSVVAASTAVDIQGVDSELGNNLTLPETALVSASGLTQGGCGQTSAQSQSSFQNSISQGLIATPDNALRSGTVKPQEQAALDCPNKP